MTTTPVSTMDTTQQPTPTRVERLQDGTLLLIVLLVGLMAGAASFNHVHDWTLDNSPDRTADWFGWANAVISELIPTASLIEIGRRRRRHTNRAKIGYPMVLLVAAVSVSLTAQLAVAQPSVFGWMVSALPALAFFALSKLVFTATASPRPTTPVTASTPATSPAPSPDTTQAQVRPAAAPTKTRATTTATKATPARKTPAQRTPATKTTAPAPPDTIPAAPATEQAPAPAARSDHRFPHLLLSNARTIATSHRDAHGEDINANQLAVRLRVPTPTATDILTQLATHPPAAINTRPHNGSTVGVSA
jgi:hypothetical protein